MNMPPAPHDTQAKRHARYGVNVAVAVIAAAVLVVMFNWIAERQLRKNLPPSARKWIRYDFTAQCQYTLSPQTLKVLADIKDPIRVVTLFTHDSPYNATQVIDLLEEYAGSGDSLTTDHLNPSRDVSRVEAFLGSLKERYAQPLQPTHQAVEQGRQALSAARKAGDYQRQVLEQLLADGDLADPRLRQFFQLLTRALAGMDRQFDRQDRLIQQSLDKPLPDFGGALTALKSLLGNLNENYGASIEQLDQVVALPATPNSVKDKLLRLLESFRSASADLNEALASVDRAKPVEEYDQLLYSLASPDPIVFVGPNQARVLLLSDLFRRPDPQQEQAGGEAELQSQAEEKITGALLSMTLTHPPLVVFVSAAQMPAFGARGPFNEVAQRLRNVSFDVQFWSPMGQPGPMGQATAPEPAPRPKPGQKAVWIVVPSAALGAASPMAVMGEQQVADLLQQRLNAGDGALVMLGALSVDVPQANPTSDLVSQWAINPQLDRVVLKQATLPDHRTQTFPLITIESWPGDLPITKALAGMSGVFPQVSPLTLSAKRPEGVTVWPLVQVQADDTWAEREFRDTPLPKLKKESAGKPLVLAAAAERGNARLVVVADPGWATDEITTYGMLGPGTAEVFGARFPANAELFVNCVHWLAGLDQLIAASARAQDIRRVGPISDSGLAGLKWSLYLGMPVAAAAAGLMVWLVRRRSA